MSIQRDFYRNKSLCILEVASDQSGNEWVVKVYKRAGYITKAIEVHQSFKQINKV